MTREELHDINVALANDELSVWDALGLLLANAVVVTFFWFIL